MQISRRSRFALLAVFTAMCASACYSSVPNRPSGLYEATAGRHYGKHYRPYVGGGGSPTIALGRHGHAEWW